MKRYEAADRRLRAKLDESAETPLDHDALFARIDGQRTLADRLPNYYHYYRRRAAWLLVPLLLGVAGTGLWWIYGSSAAAEHRTAAFPPPTAVSPPAPVDFDRMVQETDRELTAIEAQIAAAKADRHGEAAANTIALGGDRPQTSRGAGAADAPRGLADNSDDRLRTLKSAKLSTTAARAAPADEAAVLADIAPPGLGEQPASVPDFERPAPVIPAPRAAGSSLLLLDLPQPEALPLGEPKVSCAKFRPPPTWLTQVELLSGPQLGFRSLRARDAEDGVYAYNRRRTERPWYTVQTQLRVGVQSSRGWRFSTGLSLTDRHEKLDYVGENAERISIENVFAPDGTLLRTDTLTELGQRVVSWDNRYRRLDVPLLVGYAWRSHPFQVHLNAGVLLNVWSTARGRSLGPDGALTDDWTDYRARLLPDAYVSAGFNYRFAPRWTVQLEPNVRYQFGSLTTDAAPLRQRYTSFALLTGVRYQF